MRIDALVAERLTASRRIYDIYGFCGLSIFSELFAHGNLDNDVYGDEDDVDEENSAEEEQQKEVNWEPKNDLTPSQKLDMALQVAEALADLHGYAGGVIVHQDIKMDQFFWNNEKKRVKLSDFNRAEIMLWDDKKQDYCRYGEDEKRNVSRIDTRRIFLAITTCFSHYELIRYGQSVI
jgi:serine/threonine protein kinase